MIRDGEDEANSPKYAHVERERRWLVDASRLSLSSDGRVLIEDRYIAGTRMRLRRMSSAGKLSLKLTKKYEAADPLARAIVTTYLTPAEYDLLAALPAIALVKWRHPMTVGAHRFSVDCFGGPLAGLTLAEIEWPDDAGLRALPPPPSAIREVSDDPRYQGGALAAFGIPGEE